MERCDFSSISTCLKNQISESNQMNQPDFLYELFEDFMNDPINEDFSMDNGLICRWMQIAIQNGHLCHVRRSVCDIIGGQPKTN